jgi:hypothetical protein
MGTLILVLYVGLVAGMAYHGGAGYWIGAAVLTLFTYSIRRRLLAWVRWGTDPDPPKDPEQFYFSWRHKIELVWGIAWTIAFALAAVFAVLDDWGWQLIVTTCLGAATGALLLANVVTDWRELKMIEREEDLALNQEVSQMLDWLKTTGELGQYLSSGEAATDPVDVRTARIRKEYELALRKDEFDFPHTAREPELVDYVVGELVKSTEVPGNSGD